MYSDPAVFNWSNFEAFAPVLFGRHSAPTWLHTGPFGLAITYAFDDAEGRGRAEYLSLKRGLKIVIFECEWDREKTYTVCDGDWVRFNFCLDVDVAMQLNTSHCVTVSSPSWRIINNPPGAKITESIPARTKAVWVTVCCKPDFIQDIAGVALEDMPDFLQSQIPSQDGKSFYERYDFTARLNAITADVLRSKISGPIRIPYIEARCIELLCLAIDHMMHPSSDYSARNLSASDRLMLEKARGLLQKEFVSPPSVTKLGRILGVNKNKLFYGFKALFGITISEFVQEQRLNEGKRLLQETDLPVSEIAHHVGFKHQSNFATAMKKHFLMTPRQFRET